MASAMPVQDFVRNFFPEPQPPQRHPRKCKGAPPIMNPHVTLKLRKAAKASDEQGVANAWVDYMAQQGMRHPCPGYRLSLLQDQRSGGEMKTHGAIIPDGRSHPDAVCALFVFKAGGKELDPWKNGRKGDADAKTRAKVRNEVNEFVARTISRQHRTTILLFFINGLEMRLTRWQRGRTVFTEAFDYTQNCELLREVLRRFSRLDSKDLGFDRSVTPLSPEDDDYAAMTWLGDPRHSDIFEDEGTIVDSNLDGPCIFKHVRAAFAASIAGDTPRYRISVPCVTENRTFLAGKPTVVAMGRGGRDTRGYVAWDMSGKRFVWLKDVWRPVDKRMVTEGSVLRTLNNLGVRNVPTFVCDGELDHDTEDSESAMAHHYEISDTHDENDSRSGRSNGEKRSHQHYRVVVEEIGMSLTVFKNGKQLVTMVRDCMQAHADAGLKAQILHGDLSAGNVLICPTLVPNEGDGELRIVWKGLLIDWELSRPMAADLQALRGAGTWEFTSAWVLDHPSTALVTADELESFFYVILYIALRFLRNTCVDVERAIFDYFEASEQVDTQYYCGFQKRNLMEHGRSPRVYGIPYHWLDDARKGEGQPINFIIGTLLIWFHARYTILNTPATEEEEDNIIAALAGVAPVTIKVRELAQKLESHTAMLELLDDCLLRDWPQMDKVGDLLADPTIGCESEEETSLED